MIAIDEGDELFITLTNVGQVMRPDLFEQHTVHFHGYPNASAFYDGVPDASVAINVGGSFTYYYLAPEAGTYMWHCHISPPEHLQMGMVGQLYVRPKQNSVAPGGRLCARRSQACEQQLQPRAATASDCNDILLRRPDTIAGAWQRRDSQRQASTPTTTATAPRRYDVEYPIQLHGFDPNFHFVGMTFNPESFADNKDKYFLLNGRSYPDTDQSPGAAAATQGRSDGSPALFRSRCRPVINIPAGGRALLRHLGPQRHRVPHARLARHPDDA